MTVLEQYRALLASLRALPKGRASALAITNLEQSAFWASAAAEGTESPI